MTLIATETHIHRFTHATHHGRHMTAHHAAQSAAASPLSVLVGLLVAAGFVWLVVYLGRLSAKQVEASRVLAQAHLDQLTREPLSPITVPELGLQPEEVAYYSTGAEVLGTHTMTKRVGYSGGPSFRIAKGVYYHASRYTSTPVRETYTACDDKGQLIVTNQRVVFVGAHNSWSWPLAKVLSIHRFTDGVQINPVNRKAVVFTTGDEVAGIIIDRARAGSLQKAMQLQQPSS